MKTIYYCPRTFSWTDAKTGKTVTVVAGYPSDGASGAIDIFSYGWFAHDVLCDRGTWDDGTACTSRDASRVLKDILKSEGRVVRAFYWGFFTWVHTSMPWGRMGGTGLRVAQPDKAGVVERGK